MTSCDSLNGDTLRQKTLRHLERKGGHGSFVTATHDFRESVIWMS
jgi:hypothetical protein